MDGETQLTGQVIRAALKVHRELGPGLLESAYRLCLLHELHTQGIGVETEVPLPLDYHGATLECGYRIDLLVDGTVVVELKALRALDPVHTAQLLTYLKLSGLQVGLLINFNVPLLKHGIRRIVLSPPRPGRSTPPHRASCDPPSHP